MASIQKEIPIAAPAAAVWDAVRDFGAVHIRLAPGFVTDTRLDGDVRIVSFANGSVVREQLVDCNNERRRLVYTIRNQRITQHSASFQIFPEGEERCRMIWTTDVLPHEIAPYIEQQMELGARAMQDTLGRLRV
ncbi:SRPBCC family protein [Bradyrhizobium sp. 83002]|uniref:SRPBCC family protein n=1 Tax=Bradyrhizobium aeschynomenes TaxID=2734909 RepID=UPI0015520F17|nr:SRPBCC family protein [Bradyrhizobium aeschynomenes]NPU12202.1 SRPBCC family protein [Bradyrhizobium aeschynomenes]NPV24986.1 SRPBCC family protein [Bradyrhizobium aeschynomenes]